MNRKLLTTCLLLAGSVVASARPLPPPPPPPMPYIPPITATHPTTDPTPFPYTVMLSILLAQLGR